MIPHRGVRTGIHKTVKKNEEGDATHRARDFLNLWIQFVLSLVDLHNRLKLTELTAARRQSLEALLIQRPLLHQLERRATSGQMRK